MTRSVTDAAVEFAENALKGQGQYHVLEEAIRKLVAALAPPPASELVTVGQLIYRNGKLELDPFQTMRLTIGDKEAGFSEVEVVTRDQAEAREADLLRQLAALEDQVYHDRELGITWKQICEQFENECASWQERAEAAEADLLRRGKSRLRGAVSSALT